MTNFAKNVVILITFLFFIAGSGLTMVGIFNTNDLSEKYMNDKYIIPSQVLNGLTVMFLLYLSSTNTIFSPSYKLLIIFLLVGGMIIEIYLTSYADRKAESIAAYVFITLNFLIRAFFLIDLTQNEWIKPFVTPIKPIKEAVKETIVKPVEQVIKEVITPEPTSMPESSRSSRTESVGRELTSKWDSLKKLLQSKPEGLDESSQKEAWKSVIRPARDSERKDVKEVLKEAVEKLKDKDGNPVPLNSIDAIGGSRK